MGTFFRGWRRKLGVVTLITALVFMGGWVRSIGREECVLLDSNGQYPLFIDSRNHFFTLTLARHSTRPVNFTQLKLVWYTAACSEETNEEIWTLANANFPHVQIRTWIVGRLICGSSFDTTPSNPLKKWFVSIPYWFIVIPLTLASLWLLLSKPRKSPPKKITEPTASEGMTS